MTDTEKKVIVMLCSKLIQYADFDGDKEVELLVDWVLMQNSIKENNNKIRVLIGEYSKGENDRRRSIKDALERGKEICNERNKLYEYQQELKHKLWQVEQELFKR
ncbi:MAG: hypothetical protein ACRC3H_16115 [Lachnospiraceae bacterium]